MRALRLSVLLSCLTLSGLPAFAAGYHDHLGLQLWSLRDTTKVSTTKALDLAAGFGFTEVETAGTGSLGVADFAKELAARKLRAVAVHASYEALAKDTAQVIADAKTLGAKYIIVPWLPFDQAQGFTAKDAQRVAADFNTGRRVPGGRPEVRFPSAWL